MRVPLGEGRSARLALVALLALGAAACRTGEVVGALSPSPATPSAPASDAASPNASPTASPTDGEEPAVVVRTPLPGDEVVSR